MLQCQRHCCLIVSLTVFGLMHLDANPCCRHAHQTVRRPLPSSWCCCQTYMHAQSKPLHRSKTGFVTTWLTLAVTGRLTRRCNEPAYNASCERVPSLLHWHRVVTVIKTSSSGCTGAESDDSGRVRLGWGRGHPSRSEDLSSLRRLWHLCHLSPDSPEHQGGQGGPHHTHPALVRPDGGCSVRHWR